MFPLPEALPEGNIFPPQALTSVVAGVERVPGSASSDSSMNSEHASVARTAVTPPPKGSKTETVADQPAPQLARPSKQRVPPQLTIQTQSRPGPAVQPGPQSSSTTLARREDEDSGGQEPTPTMQSIFPRIVSTTAGQRQQSLSLSKLPSTACNLPPPPPLPPPGHGQLPTTYSQFPPTPSSSLTSSHLPHPRENTPGYSGSGVSDTNVPLLSSPEDLLDLWEFANCKSSQQAKDQYTLSMDW